MACQQMLVIMIIHGMIMLASLLVTR